MTRYPAAVALLINRDAPLWSIPTSCAIAQPQRMDSLAHEHEPPLLTASVRCDRPT